MKGLAGTACERFHKHTPTKGLESTIPRKVQYFGIDLLLIIIIISNITLGIGSKGSARLGETIKNLKFNTRRSQLP